MQNAECKTLPNVCFTCFFSIYLRDPWYPWVNSLLP
jgi:hypothetical protein